MRFEPLQGDTQTAPITSRRRWPDAVAYRESIQTPHTALADGDLARADVSLDRMGMPLAYSGRFAVVFRLTTAVGEKWALRCFTSPGDGGTHDTRIARYKVIAARTAEMPNTFVPFRYLEKGVRVGQEWYPALAMRWATGLPLGRWVEEHLRDPDSLRQLCAALSSLLERLEASGLAHGDWQHDNLLIAEEGRRVTLVDYDGMYTPDLAGQPSGEVGHANYQHPARTAGHWGPGLDRFACLVIETALLALAHDPGLWIRFADGESLLFKKTDFAAPEASPVFRAVRETALARGDELLAESLLRLEDACRAGAQSTLLPAIAPAPAPPPLFSALADSPTSGPAIQASGSKWWQIAEVAPAVPVSLGPSVATVAAQSSPVSPPLSSWVTAAQQAAGTTRYTTTSTTSVAAAPTYLQRLQSAETLAETRAHLWRWRAAALALLVFLGIVLYIWLADHGIFPFYFVWLLNFGAMGYQAWPRHKIRKELEAEIAKMEELIAERGRRIAVKSPSLPPSWMNGGAGVGAATLAEFVAGRLAQSPINKVLTVPGVQPTTLRELRREGVDDLRQLRDWLNAQGKLQAPRLVALQRFCQEVEMEAASDWRKVSPPSPTQTADIVRLQNEQAEFERHLATLTAQRDQFPSASFGSYLSALVGAGDFVSKP